MVESLYDDYAQDTQDILDDPEGFTVAALIITPPPGSTTFGTLDPEDLDNQIRGFMGDHYTQYDPESQNPQEGLNAKITFSLKTLLEKNVITDTIDLDFENYKIAWLDPVSGNQRDFLVDRIHPTRSLSHIVLILGEIDITP